MCLRVTERRTGACGEPSAGGEGIHYCSHIIQIPPGETAAGRVGAGADKQLGGAHADDRRKGEYPAECSYVLQQLREAMADEECGA